MTKQPDEEFRIKENHKRDHKKRHKPGFNESQDILTQRKTRINFKNYLRNLKEEEAYSDLDDDFSDLDEMDFDAKEIESNDKEV